MLTIGLPFYNAEKTLDWAIRSIANQTYGDFECLLINDGSTDASLKIAWRHAAVDARFKVIDDGANKGLVFRLNQVASLASGEWIVRMDSDDIMHPDRLLKQVELLRKNPAPDLVVCDVVIIDINNEPVSIRRHDKAGIESAKTFLKHGGLIHPTVIMAKKWLLANPYDSTFPRAEDRELWCRKLQTLKVGFVREPLFFYRLAGQVRLNAYLLSYVTERKVLLLHGPSLVGKFTTRLLWLRSWAKTCVLRFMAVFGLEQRIARPGRVLSPEDYAHYSALIKQAVAK